MTRDGLEPRLRAWYIASALIGSLTGVSLLAGYAHVARSAYARVSRHRTIVARQRDELRRMDLERIALLSQRAKPCRMARPDAVTVLTRELSRAPQDQEIDRLLSLTESLGICDLSQLDRIYRDAPRRAAVDALYRLYLDREPDFAERFTYGYWLDAGLDIESVLRDLKATPEFQERRSARSEVHSR